MSARISLVSVLFILLTTVFAVAGQVIMRWQVSRLPAPGEGAVAFVVGCVTNPSMWAVVVMAFLSMGCWSVVLSQMPLNLAYPFTSLSFLGVLLASWLVLGESPSLPTVIGVAVICVGVGIMGFGAK